MSDSSLDGSAIPDMAPDHILFAQMVSDTQTLLRLSLRIACGETILVPERDRLASALQVKQALLEGLSRSDTD